MTFFEHLEELRSRLMWSLIPFIPAFIAAWIFREEVFSLLVIPLNTAWQSMGMGVPKLHFSSPVDPMVVYLKQSAIVALMAASPWVFYQIWSFIAPGLYAHEKRMVLPLVISSSLLFMAGVAFCYFFVFGRVFD